ncbi:MAG TPA: hypothetical protein VIF14_16665 [Alphaproteobacteria bacterium]|jgi:hypothetical protein
MRVREAAMGAGAAFALNWIWENAQAPLYRGYAGFAREVWMCTVATSGDVAIVAAIFAAVALAWRDSAWHRRVSLGQALVAMIVGIGIAIAIEHRALVDGRWAYGAMPLVPFTSIGLLPVLQMAILPVVVFRFMRAAGRPSGAAE